MRLWRSILFLCFLPCFGCSFSSSTFEPILVESCVDSETGDCHAGKPNCNLRAAIELCIEIAPPLCTIYLPYGIHHVNYGPMNITTNTSTRISITSSNSVSDPCSNFRSGDDARAVIDGSAQISRLLNVFSGAYIELSAVDVSNFGHANLDKGGAILSQGGFVALDVNFYGNQAKLGAVAFNGEFGLPPSDDLDTQEEDQEENLRRFDDWHGRITDTQSALYVQHCSCDLDQKAAVVNTTSIDIYSASGQAYLDCSPSCTIEGLVKSSTTCVPTVVPTAMPSISSIPTSVISDSNDDGDDGGGSDDFFSDIAGSGLLSASSIAILLGLILCILLSCMLGGNNKYTQCKPKHGRRSSSVTSSSHHHQTEPIPSWSKDDTTSNINSSILESMYKHFGVDSNRNSFVEKSPISEPFLQAALDSMEGRPGDWIIDVRALELGPMIGVGSSAHVFSATYFGQRVAAKRLPAMTWRPEEVETFLRHEAGLLVHLHHPSVIKFYGVGISGDYVYMVTELCCGSLTNLIDRANSHPRVEQAANGAAQAFMTMRIPEGGAVDFGAVDFSTCTNEHEAAAEAAALTAAMPLHLLLSLALGIAQGVEFLHSRGVVHRDLKPDNVLLNESNEVKLCDFGISRMEQDRSGMTTAVGTPLLMAPELVLSETASQVASTATAVDVFSFGILLWMMSTQHLCPYDGVDNPWLLLSQVTQGRRPPLQVSASSEGLKLRGTNLMKLPQQFRDLIARCWDQDPLARPTFSDITKEIEALLDHVGENEFV